MWWWFGESLTPLVSTVVFPQIDKFAHIIQGSSKHLIWRDQTMQVYGNFEGIPWWKCIVWVGNSTAAVIDTTVVVYVMNMNSFTQLALLVTVNQLEDLSVKSIFPLEKSYPPHTIYLKMDGWKMIVSFWGSYVSFRECTCLRLFRRTGLEPTPCNFNGRGLPGPFVHQTGAQECPL